MPARFFVPVGGPVAAKPKFQEEKPGWVFKLGAAGLGYYIDDGIVRAIYLFPEVAPWGGARPAAIELNHLLPSKSPNVDPGGTVRLHHDIRACMTSMLLHSC